MGCTGSDLVDEEDRSGCKSVGSSGGCNGRLQYSRWGLKPQSLPRALIHA